MLISRTGKRLMAFVMAFAFVLSGIAFFPKVTNAAEEGKPVVTVLGATIRLGGETDNAGGKQSMKIGIQVSNASLAESCGITFTIGSKSITVGTSNFEGANKKYDKVYDNSPKDEEDYVIYSAVITGIPQSDFYTNVEVVGAAVATSGKEKITSNGVSKNVIGVVQSMSDAYPDAGIHLNEEGILVGVDNSVLTADKLNGGDGKLEPNASNEIQNLPLVADNGESNVKPLGDNKVTLQEDGTVKCSGGNNGFYIHFTDKPLAEGSKVTVCLDTDLTKEAAEEGTAKKFRAYISIDKDTSEADTSDKFGYNYKAWDTEDNRADDCTTKEGLPEGYYEYTATINHKHPKHDGGYDLTFRAPSGGTFPEMTIKSIKVYIEENADQAPTPTPSPVPAKYEMDLNKFKGELGDANDESGDITAHYNDSDKSIDIFLREKMMKGIVFEDVPVNEYKYAQIKYTSTEGTPYFYCADSMGGGVQLLPTEQDKVVTVSCEDFDGKLFIDKIKVFNWIEGDFENAPENGVKMTIKSITLFKDNPEV